MGEKLPVTSAKERDYMFDVFRGVLMLSIPLSHFTKASANWYAELWYGAGFNHASLSGFIYITINVFVMQAFMFLSGYFSKNPQRARETAFRGVLWPYLVFTTITMVAAWGFDAPIGKYFSYTTPSFALWFLLALFFYRFFLVEMVKFKWALQMSIVLMLIAGFMPLGQFLALGRVFSYLPFFLLGYYCSKETLDKVRSLKQKPYIVAILAVALLAMSYYMMKDGPRAGWFLLKQSAQEAGVDWVSDVIFRGVVFVVACGWIVLMVNILPSKKNFLCHIGTNTMPIYIFHLGLRHVFTQKGVYVGCIGTLFVALISAISLLHKKHGRWWISILLTAGVTAGFVVLCMKGVLVPLYGGCPENLFVYYVMVIGSALLAGVSFGAPVWVKLYSILTEGFESESRFTSWLKGEKDGSGTA